MSRVESMARTESPQGVVAFAEPVLATPLEELATPLDGRPPLLVAADGLTDPGNLGAILRTAEVAGVTGVILTRHRAVRLTPAAVKSAAGAVEYLRIALVGGLPAALAQLSAAGVWIVGLDVSAPQNIATVDLKDEPVVLVVGSEGKGLSSLVRQRCDVLASIAKHGKIDSLNVSAACAVALYEMVRPQGAEAGDMVVPTKAEVADMDVGGAEVDSVEVEGTVASDAVASDAVASDAEAGDMASGSAEVGDATSDSAVFGGADVGDAEVDGVETSDAEAGDMASGGAEVGETTSDGTESGDASPRDLLDQ